MEFGCYTTSDLVMDILIIIELGFIELMNLGIMFTLGMAIEPVTKVGEYLMQQCSSGVKHVLFWNFTKSNTSYKILLPF